MKKIVPNQEITLMQIGHPKHLKEGLKSPNKWVRNTVALCGNKEQVEQLLNDSDYPVKLTAYNRWHKEFKNG